MTGRNGTRSGYMTGVLVAVLLGTAMAPLPRHLRLVKAEPAVDRTISTAPAMIRLHFSQEPQIKGTSIRVIDAAERDIALAEAMADSTDAKIVYATVEAAMTAGRYTVMWRAMAKDGHVVRDEYHFTVKPTE